MRLLIHNDRIAATATDDYEGPDAWLPEPEGFDVLRLAEYRLVDGALVIPPPPPVQSVSMRQARLALLGANLLTDVNAALAGMAGVEGEAARIEWEYATEVRRDSDLVSGLSSALGLTPALLDALFETAATL
jgi:hypothetical protein